MSKATTVAPVLVVSQLEILDIASKSRDVIHVGADVFEAPNWHPYDNYLIINRAGYLYRVDLESHVVKQIDTDFAVRCNNDHGISADGKWLVVSHHDSESDDKSVLYILPVEGGVPRRVTEHAPSYWHGWSPDGKTLAYVAGRTASKDYDIYSISVEGGPETRLTATPGLDDGPDYSPCGRYIYYNSYQTGMMQIWRMDADGANPVQLVESPHSDWFPHPSPDGKWLVFIRYLENQQEAHPFGRDVQLMLLNNDSGELQPLTDIFYGGQGSLNVPSWSPDSKKLAFVSYIDQA
ncbi:TolB family protein [Teredinibacter waterburyi]|jgi:Periplasmic component of the Tol biopolymer transport system|uniref:TolB family protein n=1 Tax=Teredinibacter waterburyi TaxID=1500538 RepID=UPI001CAA843D|nr:hypothetical protein [Teredinibacter waterburyi]